MKTMIRNIRFLFIRYVFGSAIVLLFSSTNYCCTSHESAGNISDTIDIINTLVFDNENNKYHWSDTGNYLVVLQNNRNCIDCFTAINHYVHVVKDSLNARYVVMAFIDSNSLERKRNSHFNKILLPEFDDYVFQYKSNESNLFDKLGVIYTPELLLIRQKHVIYIPYKKLYTFPDMNISVNTQLQIYDLLK